MIEGGRACALPFISVSDLSDQSLTSVPCFPSAIPRLGSYALADVTVVWIAMQGSAALLDDSLSGVPAQIAMHKRAGATHHATGA